MGKSNKKSKFVLSAAIAAGAGYLAGILTAPKSGKETRKDIKDTAVKARQKAEKELQNLHGELDKLIAQGKAKAKGLSDKARDELNNLVGRAQESKDKIRTVLGALREGSSDDKDLQKAIKEAEQAQKHLKAYLNKRDKKA